MDRVIQLKEAKSTSPKRVLGDRSPAGWALGCPLLGGESLGLEGLLGAQGPNQLLEKPHCVT